MGGERDDGGFWRCEGRGKGEGIRNVTAGRAYDELGWAMGISFLIFWLDPFTIRRVCVLNSASA